MLAHADALPLAAQRAGEPQWRQAVARSVQERRDVSEFDKCEIGRDAYPAHDHRAAGIGSIAVPSIWPAFYVIAAVHQFIASGN